MFDLSTPAQSSVGAWWHLSPALALISSPHPSLSITVGHPTSLWRGDVVVTPPGPNPSPQKNISRYCPFKCAFGVFNGSTFDDLKSISVFFPEIETELLDG